MHFHEKWHFVQICVQFHCTAVTSQILEECDIHKINETFEEKKDIFWLDYPHLPKLLLLGFR